MIRARRTRTNDLLCSKHELVHGGQYMMPVKYSAIASTYSAIAPTLQCDRFDFTVKIDPTYDHPAEISDVKTR